MLINIKKTSLLLKYCRVTNENNIFDISSLDSSINKNVAHPDQR